MTPPRVSYQLLMCLALTAVGGCGHRSEDASAHETGRPNATRAHRIVTLTPSATELVASLAGADALVGVDQYSVYPDAVRKLPKVGSFLSPNVEVIISLKPTLVVLDAVQTKYRRSFAAADIPVLVFKMHTIDDVKKALVQLGTALGKQSQADAAVRRLSAVVDRFSARALARSTAARPKVLVVVDREPGNLGRMVVAGPGSFLDEVLAIVGGANAMSSAGSKYVNIAREQVMQTKPDVIIETMRHRDLAHATRDWARMPELPAVKHGRVHAVDDQVFVSPGPRLADALAAFERLVLGNQESPGPR